MTKKLDIFALAAWSGRIGQDIPIVLVKIFNAIGIGRYTSLKKYILGQCLYFYLNFSQHTQTSLMKLIMHNSIAMFCLKTLAGFEPGHS
jgi:hypothetical protein